MDKSAILLRKIVPPKLADHHILERITCYRPVRSGSPRMIIERINGKIIVQNYGHGGSGWTLGPGAGNYTAELVRPHFNANDRVVVIGAGVIGLFSAYALAKEGYHLIKVISEFNENSSSYNAGGLICPISMDNDIDGQVLVDEIGIVGYKFYASIAMKCNPDFHHDCVSILPLYFQDRELSGLELYVSKGVMNPPKDVMLDFGNGTTRKMVAYDDGLFVQTHMMVKMLREWLQNKGIEFVTAHVNSIDELDGDVIVNCTGLKAEKLDKSSQQSMMIPVQGHLISLRDQSPHDLQYMIVAYFGEGKTEANQKVKRAFYIFPKIFIPSANDNDVGVIGGTFVQGGNCQTPNEGEFEILIQNARDYFGL